MHNKNKKWSGLVVAVIVPALFLIFYCQTDQPNVHEMVYNDLTTDSLDTTPTWITVSVSDTIPQPWPPNSKARDHYVMICEPRMVEILPEDRTLRIPELKAQSPIKLGKHEVQVVRGKVDEKGDGLFLVQKLSAGEMFYLLRTTPIKE